MPLPVISLNEWKDQALTGQQPRGVQLRKVVTFDKAEEVADEPDALRITITTSGHDREWASRTPTGG
jgi:hypothetical protein